MGALLMRRLFALASRVDVRQLLRNPRMELGRIMVWLGRRIERVGRNTGSGHRPDRKSTRLNSSHSQISYAVFCLKKKKKKKEEIRWKKQRNELQSCRTR